MNVVQLTKEVTKENMNQLLEIEKFIEGDEWGTENYLVDLEKKWEFSRTAMMDDKIVGFIICSRKKDAFYIHRVGILPEYQGKGIGSSLLEYAFKKCSEENLNYIILQVKKFNTQGQKFYENKGFKKIGENGPNYVYCKSIKGGNELKWDKYVQVL